ncbi:MAG TPA: thrombospondin type 3 repeat-containing protein [Polyangia bacterium]|nr:thrombospondin type 3 repeat-containing protein [Polyangia bacterium]
MTHSKRSSSAILGGLALLVVSGARQPWAQARDEFPREIASHLGAPTAPPCGVCHEYGKQGIGATVVTPFGWALRARGLGDGDGLAQALDRLVTDKVDSDGDGSIDTDEIVAGSDPNSAASTPAHPGAVSDPQLGCAAAGGRSSSIALGAISLALLITAARSRRSR